MDLPGSPPSPLYSANSPPESLQSRPHSKRSSTRSGKDRKNHPASRSKELVRLLITEESESHGLRTMVQTLSERLGKEAGRADAAEARAQEAVLRFKQVNDARIAAQREAARAGEELALYKLQLDNAQREIRRAQDLLDALEAQRFEAEESAARARSTARKLKEERLVQIARDEGRVAGIKEGMIRGRALGYEEGRAEGYARWRTTGSRGNRREGSPSNVVPFAEDSFNPRNTVPSSDSAVQSTQDDSIPHAERIVVHSPPTESLRRSPPQNSEIHPILVHNAPASPQHIPLDYPPEGWIPTIEGNRIRLPPPHELSPSPFSPSQLPSHTPPPTHILPPAPEGTPEPLMIPPPSHRMTSDHEPLTSNNVRPRMVRRRRSSDSQSTTFSQFDLVSLPSEPSARPNVGPRPNVLSAIIEESTPSASPAYVPAPAPRMPSPVTIPTPEAPTPILPHVPQEEYYRRPVSTSSRDSSVRPIPSRNQLRPTTSSPKGSISSNASIPIAVVPPSRPESSRSGYGPAEQGMLSANDAEHTSAPVPSPEPPLPIHVNDGNLPPGFVPIGGPPAAPNSSQTPGMTPAMYGLYHPADGEGSDNFPQATEPVVVPMSTTGAKRYSRTAMQPDSSSDDSQSRPLSSDSSSSSSSMDSFTTPPQRRKPLAAAAYATAPTPPNVTYPLPQSRPSTSRTSSAPRVVGDSPQTSTLTGARVPLPASSVGSPRSVYTRASRRGGSTTVGPTSPVMVPNRVIDSLD
ncbi:hypothetical protein PHLGIDRAFT_33918 [Phlebiopsis gigantea 11061_1 CR5-6]|uniref:Uncharacterized protein n=1 Tax=Phlebiopsis gigantea (strain 11061_1 CR5-6) TaxID=745531 RepID=A0A0C3SED0_PHLG1|nr:hypothetical protein PHLGIDRAFT_33918 [Phlebiopsis gigantea 11061_1 CR5-6]